MIVHPLPQKLPAFPATATGARRVSSGLGQVCRPRLRRRGEAPAEPTRWPALKVASLWRFALAGSAWIQSPRR